MFAETTSRFGALRGKRRVRSWFEGANLAYAATNEGEDYQTGAKVLGYSSPRALDAC